MQLPRLPIWAIQLGLKWRARPERKELWLHKALVWLDADGFHANVEDCGDAMAHHYGHVDRLEAIRLFLLDCEELFLYDAISDGVV